MSGQGAFEAGIVTQVVPTAAELDGAVEDLVQRLASGGPHALRATKRLLNELDGSLDAGVVRRGLASPPPWSRCPKRRLF